MLKQLFRSIPFFNTYENEGLTIEFEKKVKKLREKNSQEVFNNYYMPIAKHAILEEDGYMTTDTGAYPRATAMMMSDIANGVLDEFYQFK